MSSPAGAAGACTCARPPLLLISLPTTPSPPLPPPPSLSSAGGGRGARKSPRCVACRRPRLTAGSAGRPDPTRPSMTDTLRWDGTTLYLLDQSALPHDERVIECRTYRDVIDAIRT